MTSFVIIKEYIVSFVSLQKNNQIKTNKMERKHLKASICFTKPNSRTNVNVINCMFEITD